MRADRLLSLMLLLRHRGRMSATALAAELEVSTRTVLRDVEALSAAGVPVYAERGRTGGFALLPGFTTDLTGLTPGEALALLTAGSAERPAPGLASAMRKVLVAMPDDVREKATRSAARLVVRRDGFLRPAAAEGPLDVVRRAVFGAHRLRLRYAPSGRSGVGVRDEGTWRTVDPIGLVNAAGHWYLLATRDGADRTYRVSRIREAVELDESAARATDVDVQQLWERRRAEFVAGIEQVRVVARVSLARRHDLVRAAMELHDERPAGPDHVRLELTFGGPGHAEGTLWQLGADAEVLAPAGLRERLSGRASAMAALLEQPNPGADAVFCADRMSARPEITRNDLRNLSTEIMDGVENGQGYVLTREGHPIGELLPIRPRPRVSREAFAASLRAAPESDPGTTASPTRTEHHAEAGGERAGILDEAGVSAREECRFDAERDSERACGPVTDLPG